MPNDLLRMSTSSLKGPGLARTEIKNSALGRFERANTSFDDVFDVNEVAFLFALFENARSLPGFYLLSEVVNHASRHAFVRLARTINIEVTKTDNDPVSTLPGLARGDVIHDCLGKSVDVRRCGAV